MKIQTMAVIFILIIVPISLLLSEYIQAQIDTLGLQTSYDSKLIGAAYDTVKAFQLNALNSSNNDILASKIKDIEAASNVFMTSIANNFGTGYIGKKAIESYVPAVVFCLYDGYYIYSPYTNDLSGITQAREEILSSTGKKFEPTYKDKQTLTGLKPYIYYSCRYIHSTTDVVITYSLDNYVTIQGMVGGDYWNESGYILDGCGENLSGFDGRYNGVEIPKSEQLKEEIYDPETKNKESYSYAKVDGTKYYKDKAGNIFYMQNAEKKYITAEADKVYYSNKITTNDSAYNFYKQAYNFTNKVRNSELNNLTFGNAVDVDGDSINAGGFSGNKYIFRKETNKMAEEDSSNFTEHRIAVIRYAIQKNLTTAIANYNNNFSEGTAAFAMPDLTETDWYKINNNISIITFLQGLPIGGKIYNGYKVITNNKNEDFVAEESIYITDSTGQYHRFDEKDLDKKSNLKGYLNIDFEMHTDDAKMYYYPRPEEGSYISIVNQSGVEGYDNLYEYLSDTSNSNVAQAYYTALGRERYGMYRYMKLDPTDSP